MRTPMLQQNVQKTCLFILYQSPLSSYAWPSSSWCWCQHPHNPRHLLICACKASTLESHRWRGMLTGLLHVASSVIISPHGQLLRMHLAAYWRRQQWGLCNPGNTVKRLHVISVLAHHCWRSCRVFLSSFCRHQSSEVARCFLFPSWDSSVYIWCFITRDF